MKSLLAAISFLTRIPVGSAEFDASEVARAAGWFPLVGAMLGTVAAGLAFVLKPHLPMAAIAVLLVLFDALVTGALHYDGLADTADGFGGGKNREDILRIMRDHAIGSYGGVALAILVALKAVAYFAVLTRPEWIVVLIVTPALGRWSILLLTAALPYARPSPSPVDEMGKGPLVLGTLIVAVTLPASVSVRPWIAAAVVIAMTAMFGSYCRRKIGGITGDTLGANLQICECAALLTFLWTGFTQGLSK